MTLQMSSGTYLDAKEAARELGLAHGSFRNYRTERGDRFLKGHALLPGRVFFLAEDVEALRQASPRVM